jgi:predicted deacylase
MRGAFVAIPIANPFAYEARARVAPLHIDGLNLARVFPGDAGGSPSRILAHQLLQVVLRNLGAGDLFLDFHSGSAETAYATLIGFRDLPGPTTAAAEEAARHFGLDRLWRIPDAPGPFNAETARRGVVTLGTETTGRAGCAAEDVAAFVAGLTNLLTYLGMLSDQQRPPRFAGTARATVDVVAPTAGFLRGARQLYEQVAAGELLGTLITPFGDPLAEVRAPIGGTLWAARTMPPVRTGELLYMIAERV